jgi:hypothetical protein
MSAKICYWIQAWAGQSLMIYITHMIIIMMCKLGQLCLTAFGFTGAFWSAPEMQNTAVMFHVCPPAQADPTVCILWRTGYWFFDCGLDCSCSPAPGVTPFEYFNNHFIRSREANKTYDGALHVSKTLHSLVWRRLDKKPIRHHTDKLVH